MKHRYCTAILAWLLLLGLSGIGTSARSRSTASLKFEIKVVDSVTHKAKSNFVLGEKVSVVFTLTNLGRHARTIPELNETYIPWQLVSTSENDDPKTVTGARGGSGSSYVRPDGTVDWTEREPRSMTLAPRQSVSVKIDDLRGDNDDRLRAGEHTLSATYGKGLKATVSFRVVIDEAKSIPLLESFAEASTTSENDRGWASNYLDEIKKPSLSGIVTDRAGRPLKGVDISVTGPEKSDYDSETRSNGRYHRSQLKRGGTYTVTPSLTSDGNFRANYTFDPPTRTITNLNSKLTNLNFTATKVRPSTNVAEKFEGSTARASSTFTAPDDKFEAEEVIDGVRSSQWDRCCNAAWNDDTPNSFPDWIEVDFKGRKTIDWINVFTLQDAPEASPEPTLTETFTKDGITDFDVQYWNGRVWQNVPGGAIRGNRNVWRKIEFPTIATNKIRVVVRKSLSGYSRIMEIEAFHINDVPTVKLTGSSKGRTGSNFQFQTNASDADRAIYKYTVDFGDGTPNYELEYGDKPAVKELRLMHSHTYAAAGTYTVTLRVLDHDDEGSETTMTVVVTDPPKPPFATGANVYEGIVGKEVVFEGRSSSDPKEKVSYRWNFGDDKTGVGARPSHRYAAPGTYTVTVTVEDIDGRTMRYAALAKISAAPPSLSREFRRQTAK